MNKENKDYHKNIFLVVVVVLVLLTSGWLVLTRNHRKSATLYPQTTGPTPEQTQADAAANADAKKKLIEDTEPNNGTITRPSIELNAQQESNNTVTIFTKLPGYGGGVCELMITSESKITKQTAKVIYQPDYASCAGFSVPINTLQPGIWTIELSVTNNGTTETKTISYEVR